MRRCIASLFMLSAIWVLGCNNEPYSVAPVSGKVTLNGKPVAQAAVMFQPVAPKGTENPGPGSTGVTDEEGRYSLKVIGKENTGAVIGLHKVRITNFEAPGDPTDDKPRKAVKPTVKIPGEYNKQDAKLEFQVTNKGSDKADFELVGK